MPFSRLGSKKATEFAFCPDESKRSAVHCTVLESCIRCCARDRDRSFAFWFPLRTNGRRSSTKFSLLGRNKMSCLRIIIVSSMSRQSGVLYPRVDRTVDHCNLLMTTPPSLCLVSRVASSALCFLSYKSSECTCTSASVFEAIQSRSSAYRSVIGFHTLVDHHTLADLLGFFLC